MEPVNKNGENGGRPEEDGPLTASLLLSYKTFKSANLSAVKSFESKKLADTESQFFAEYNFKGHEIQVILLAEALPNQLLDFILPICHFREEDKNSFRSAEAHMILFYQRGHEDLVEQLSALYEFSSLIQDGLVGVINENSWTAHPTAMIAHVLGEPTKEGLGFNTWLSWTGGFVKYFLPNDNGVWYATKGNYQFGFKEFAMKGSPEQGEEIIELFWVLFNYCLNNGIDFNPGETMTIGEGKNMTVGDVTEYHEYLMGEQGTVVLSL